MFPSLSLLLLPITLGGKKKKTCAIKLERTAQLPSLSNRHFSSFIAAFLIMSYSLHLHRSLVPASLLPINHATLYSSSSFEIFRCQTSHTLSQGTLL